VPWPRPVPTIGDQTSSAQRASAPDAWAFPHADVDALNRVIGARRDVRRFRPDPVGPALLRSLLDAAHRAPSVGHSQPWRFVVVRDPLIRQQAATLADRERLAQAALLDDSSGRHLLDLDLEGIREAPLGIVVCCDRRTPGAGVLGRATYLDSDLWSCACAIENLWLAARASGLGVGWVTLFEPGALERLVAAPEGVATLGWLCVGWPDERPPGPGLERRGWSERRPLDDVVIEERWPSEGGPTAPPSRLRPPQARLRPPPAAALVAARDEADRLLAGPSALGVLDRVLDRISALPGFVDTRDEMPGAQLTGTQLAGTLVLVAADHPVAGLGVSAYPSSVTRHVLEASLVGSSVGAVAAAQAGLDVIVVDAGIDGDPQDRHVSPEPRRHRPLGRRGDLVTEDAMTIEDVSRLVEAGRRLGIEAATSPVGEHRGVLVALGEVGVGNTTVAAALAAILLDGATEAMVGLGAGADRAILSRKAAVVDQVRRRWNDRVRTESGDLGPWEAMATAGGPELAVLSGVCLGAAETGAAVVLDGLATSVAALAAVRAEPALAAHLVAGQRSREQAHVAVLGALGLEPLLDLRLRAGEGAGACLATGLLRAGWAIRHGAAQTS
jgi:nicotinate-nucleotide--dimethylbenzimidazole phosphoribosyltransferase